MDEPQAPAPGPEQQIKVPMPLAIGQLLHVLTNVDAFAQVRPTHPQHILDALMGEAAGLRQQPRLTDAQKAVCLAWCVDMITQPLIQEAVKAHLSKGPPLDQCRFIYLARTGPRASVETRCQLVHGHPGPHQAKDLSWEGGGEIIGTAVRGHGSAELPLCHATSPNPGLSCVLARGHEGQHETKHGGRWGMGDGKAVERVKGRKKGGK